MKKYLLLIILSFELYIPNCFSQAGQWTWMKGDNTGNAGGVYGMQGTPNSANTPPSRYEAAEWTDKQGNFWLFGGAGTTTSNNYGDLWKFDPSINQWAWMKGTNMPNQYGIYGILGMPSLSNNPGCRGWGAPTWVDTSGNLWIFGGLGYDSAGYTTVLNDLWKYDINNNEWTWINGPDTGLNGAVYGTIGVFDSTNNPGNRAESDASWTDKNGNLWMFGGAIYHGIQGSYGISGSAGDLWEYNISKNQWAWIKGPQAVNASGVYGTLGVPDVNNYPGARDCYNKWTDANGDFWLFGGTNVSNGDDYNDLWRYNIATNTWTWMSGSKLPNDSATAATQCNSSSIVMPSARHESRASYMDACGNFWLMGGLGLAPGFLGLNDLWKYNPVDSQWTWASGQNGGGTPSFNYGTQGTSSATNMPPGRNGHLGWTDKSGNFWVWGGLRGSITSGAPEQNDLWRFVPDTNCTGGSCSAALPPPTAGFSSSDSNFCQNTCINYTNLSLNSTSWQWSFQGGFPSTSTDQNPQNICYLSVGSFDVSLVASNGIVTDTVTFSNFIGVNPAPTTPVITQSSDTLFCSTDTSYISYQWYDDTTLIVGATQSYIIYTNSGNYNVLVSNKYGCSIAVGDNITGIDEFSIHGSEFFVSPNPAHDYLNLYAKSTPSTNLITVSILNPLGQIVQEEKVKGSNVLNISVTNLRAGIYFIRVLGENSRWIGRFVKE